MLSPAEIQNVPPLNQASRRLHYLDWLRVIAIFMVFLFHAVHPFDQADWHIKNIQQSETLSIIMNVMFIWGLPFFFLVSGAGSWFALQRRSSAQYLKERTQRLFFPWIAGLLLLTPVQVYLEWSLKFKRDQTDIPFSTYLFDFLTYGRSVGFSPRWFDRGEHLWFLGFLFAFAVISLPILVWFSKDAGRSFISSLASFTKYRGGLLVLLLLPLAIRLITFPFFPAEHDWSDFFFYLAFFVLGYLLYADARFLQALRRDRWLVFGSGTLALLVMLAGFIANLPIMDWYWQPGSLGYFVVRTLVTLLALTWTLAMIVFGLRYLDFSNSLLRYGQRILLPFFVLHQPIIIVIAYFIVQLSWSIPVKMIAVVTASLLVVLGFCQFVIIPIRPLHPLLGMKSPDRRTAEASEGQDLA